MSINYFEGNCGEFFTEDSTDSYIPCICGQESCLAAWSPQSPRFRSRHQQLPSHVYYEDAHGNIMPAGRDHEPIPNGCVRREAGTLAEMRAIERRYTRQELDKREIFVENEQRERAEVIAESRRELRRVMEQGYINSHGEHEHFSEQGKDFARMAMARNDAKSTVYDKRVDPGVHIHALHYDEKRR